MHCGRSAFVDFLLIAAPFPASDPFAVPLCSLARRPAGFAGSRSWPTPWSRSWARACIFSHRAANAAPWLRRTSTAATAIATPRPIRLPNPAQATPGRASRTAAPDRTTPAPAPFAQPWLASARAINLRQTNSSSRMHPRRLFRARRASIFPPSSSPATPAALRSADSRCIVDRSARTQASASVAVGSSLMRISHARWRTGPTGPFSESRTSAVCQADLLALGTAHARSSWFHSG